MFMLYIIYASAYVLVYMHPHSHAPRDSKRETEGERGKCGEIVRVYLCLLVVCVYFYT